jgi:hypothetical protein
VASGGRAELCGGAAAETCEIKISTTLGYSACVVRKWLYLMVISHVEFFWRVCIRACTDTGLQMRLFLATAARGSGTARCDIVHAIISLASSSWRGGTTKLTARTGRSTVAVPAMGEAVPASTKAARDGQVQSCMSHPHLPGSVCMCVCIYVCMTYIGDGGYEETSESTDVMTRMVADGHIIWEAM